MAMIVPLPRHPEFWENHPRLLDRWNDRHPNYAIAGMGRFNPRMLAGMGDTSSTMLILAAGALALFFTPLGKRLMNSFKGD